MFEVEITRNFAAAHQLDKYEGDCSRLHGHNWIVKVSVKTEKLNKIGIAVDFRELKNALDKILANLDHHNLNNVNHFKNLNPTSENVAKYIYIEMTKAINAPSLKISKVSVSESPDSTASYYE